MAAIERTTAGSGRATGSSTTLGLSFSVTFAAPATGVKILLSVVTSLSTNATDLDAITHAATFGGLDMTAWGGRYLINAGATSGVTLAYFYRSVNIPSAGTYTMAITTAGTANKVSIIGVAAVYSSWDVAYLIANDPYFGTAANPSLTTPSEVGGMVSATISHAVAITAVSQTEVYRNGGSVTGLGDYVAVQDAVGTGSDIVSAITAASGVWVGRSVRMVPHRDATSVVNFGWNLSAVGVTSPPSVVSNTDFFFFS